MAWKLKRYICSVTMVSFQGGDLPCGWQISQDQKHLSHILKNLQKLKGFFKFSDMSADPNTCSNYSGKSDVLLLLQLVSAGEIGSQKMSMLMQCFNRDSN